jgi:neurotransmitter:Na+ symporter, NSS family
VAVADLEGLTGPILSFVTFPAVIAEMPGGNVFGAVFFAALVMAGFTSIISILLGVAASVQEKFGWTRRAASITVSLVCATLSLSFFSTTSGLLALDTVDQWANNVGIVVSAIVMTVLVVWVLRTAPALAAHLNAVSTFRVGRLWVALIGVLAPLFLGYMLFERLRVLIAEGYEGLPQWYLNLFGWGVVGAVMVGALVLAALPWRNPEEETFVAWPELEEDGNR